MGTDGIVGTDGIDVGVLVAEWPTSSASVAVVDRSGARSTTGDTTRALRVASVTKPVVALAVLVAVEEGTISLDDAAGPPGATVRHLLSHASGLPFEEAHPVAPPGVQRIYSNTGFDRLGEHLADRADMPVGQYVAEAVLAPLGMTSSELAGSPAKDLWSCTDDLARFAHEVMSPTLVGPATLAEATTPAYPDLAGILPGIGNFDPNPWGLGFEVRGQKRPHWTGTSNSPATFGHFGGTGTFLWVDPEIDVAVVCLTDVEFGPWSMRAWPQLSDAVVAAARGVDPDRGSGPATASG